jgi:hypothetical protein
MNSWIVRAGVVVGLTYLAYRFAPAGVARSAVIAIGAVSTAGLVASGVPQVGALLSGNVGALLPAATA